MTEAVFAAGAYGHPQIERSAVSQIKKQETRLQRSVSRDDSRMYVLLFFTIL